MKLVMKSGAVLAVELLEDRIRGLDADHNLV